MTDERFRSRNHASRRIIIACLFACLVSTTIAQIPVPTALGGGVTDPSGGVVSGAYVSVKNEDTGQVSNTVTNALGEYRIEGIPPGTYDVTVRAEGFVEVTRTGVVSNIGMISNLDIKLFVGSGVTVPLGSGTLVTSRELLREGKHEEKGFGLYSYILFGSPPNDATRERYLATISSFLAIPSTREMIRNVPRKQLNVTYVPTKAAAQPSSAEKLLKAYDYARASGLLARIPCKQGDVLCGSYLAGPYIISTTKPLTEQASLSDSFLYQDISSVPARIVPLWVDEFMAQSSQAEFWKKRKGPQVALELRTAIAIAADGIPDVGHSADSWKKALSSIRVWK
jgi:hypothetical protein